MTNQSTTALFIPSTVCFVGPSGAGKSTLLRNLGVVDAFRVPDFLQAQGIRKKEDLDDSNNEIVAQAAVKAAIVDGFPRTVAQAQALAAVAREVVIVVVHPAKMPMTYTTQGRISVETFSVERQLSRSAKGEEKRTTTMERAAAKAARWFDKEHPAIVEAVRLGARIVNVDARLSTEEMVDKALRGILDVGNRLANVDKANVIARNKDVRINMRNGALLSAILPPHFGAPKLYSDVDMNTDDEAAVMSSSLAEHFWRIFHAPVVIAPAANVTPIAHQKQPHRAVEARLGGNRALLACGPDFLRFAVTGKPHPTDSATAWRWERDCQSWGNLASPKVAPKTLAEASGKARIEEGSAHAVDNDGNAVLLERDATRIPTAELASVRRLMLSLPFTPNEPPIGVNYMRKCEEVAMPLAAALQAKTDDDFRAWLLHDTQSRSGARESLRLIESVAGVPLSSVGENKATHGGGALVRHMLDTALLLRTPISGLDNVVMSSKKVATLRLAALLHDVGKINPHAGHKLGAHQPEGVHMIRRAYDAHIAPLGVDVELLAFFIQWHDLYGRVIRTYNEAGYKKPIDINMARTIVNDGAKKFYNDGKEWNPSAAWQPLSWQHQFYSNYKVAEMLLMLWRADTASIPSLRWLAEHMIGPHLCTAMYQRDGR